MAFGVIYNVTWWGFSSPTGFGSIYAGYATPLEILLILQSLESRATYYENVVGTTSILTNLENCKS